MDHRVMAVLGQGLLPPAPPPIAGPPTLEHLLLESPWGLAIGLCAVGAAVWYALARAGKPGKGLIIGGLAAALGAGAVLTARLVTTDREHAVERLRGLVAAVARGDGAGTGEYLSDRLTVRMLGAATTWGKPDVTSRVERYLNGVYRLKDREARVRDVRAGSPSGVEVQTQVRVTVVPENAPYPTDTWWVVTWRKDTDGAWRAVELDIQQIEGMRPGTRID